MSSAQISLSRIRKVFSMGDVQVEALGGLSLTICSGEFVAIMGSSGSGKSTLMNILGCLDTPTSGSYHFEGVKVDATVNGNVVTRVVLARNVARIFAKSYELVHTA